MANKFTTKVTNEGLNLLQLASQQDKKVEFINVIASSTAYSESQLISETYDDINSRASKNQTGTINNLTIDKNITKMELVFDGHDIKSDYTLNSIFLIAKLKDNQDLKLFAVIKANQPQYMNSYDGSGSTNLQINLGVKFSNNDKVTLQIDTAAIATLGDLSNLRNETQTKLDKETSRATEKETSLQKDLEIEKNRANQSEIELQNKIDSEVSRAQKTEKDLTASLSAEKNRAIQAENDLSGRITTEQNRAMSRENYIDVKIDKEKDRATSKENEIANNIQSAANDARTNAKNDAITAIKSDNQWQSMGNIITNSPFLQNSDGFAQEVVRTATPMIEGGGINLLKGTSKELKQVTTTNDWVRLAGAQVFKDMYPADNFTAKVWIEKPNKDSWLQAWVGGNGLFKGNVIKAGQSGYSEVHGTLKNEVNNANLVLGAGDDVSVSLGYKELKLEKGTIATDWSPAPEDLATKLQLNQVIDTTNNMQKQITDETSRATKAEQDIKDLANSNKSRLDAKDAHILIDNKSDDVTNIFDVRDKYNTKNVIQSLVGDESGSAVGIGNNGLTVIGGGESSPSILHHVKNQKAIDGTVYKPQDKELFLASDSNVKIITNTQDSANPANYKVTNFDVNGNVQIPGKIYSNKNSKSIEDQIKDETTRAQSEEKRIDNKINYLSNNKSIKEITVDDMNDLTQEGIYFSKKQLNNLDTRFADKNNFIIITGNQDYISQIVISEVGAIIFRYREDGEWSKWIKMIHDEDLKRLPLSEINPSINELVKTVSEIKERQKRPPTGYALDTSTKPWSLLFDNGCIIYNSSYWDNSEIFRPDPPNNRGKGDFPIYSIPDTIMNVLKGLILYSDFKNSNWDGGFFGNTTVENRINNGDKYNWDGTKIRKDGTSANNRAIFARTIYELGIWSDEIVEELGAVRK